MAAFGGHAVSTTRRPETVVRLLARVRGGGVAKTVLEGCERKFSSAKGKQ